MRDNNRNSSAPLRRSRTEDSAAVISRKARPTCHTDGSFKIAIFELERASRMITLLA
jgi:hypothetical protein